MQHDNTTNVDSPVKASKTPKSNKTSRKTTRKIPTKAPRGHTPPPPSNLSGKGRKSLGLLSASLNDQTGVTKKNTKKFKKIYGTSVKPFNYLNHIKINKVWKLEFKKLLSEAIRDYENNILEDYEERNEDGVVAVAEADDFTTDELVNYFASPSINKQANPVGSGFLDRSPQIQNSAKQLLYNTMDHIGKDVLMGYNEQRCINLRETIQPKDCCAQWFGKHSFKQGHQLMLDSKNVFSQ